MAMRTIFQGLTVAAAVYAGTAQAATVRVADGDCAALFAALDADGEKDVVLARKGTYNRCAIRMHGKAHLDAAGATLGSLEVVQGASLAVRNARFVAWETTAQVNASAGKGQGVQSSILLPGITAFIRNDGELSLEASSISGITFGVLPGPDTPLLYNAGKLVLRNATIVGNRDKYTAALIRNDGEVQILQSTIVAEEPTPLPLTPALLATTGSVSVGNSVLVAKGMPACLGAITSLGGNVMNDAGCAGSGDRVASDAGLATAGDHGGNALTVPLRAGSVAIGAGKPDLCEASDSRGATRGAQGCDAGAYEYGGGNGRLAAGGMNGTYYNAGSDGHYVMIQRIDDGLMLVTWSTFDRRGEAALIYGVGEATGTHVHVAQAARNVGGVLQADGKPRGQHAVPWGTIDIDFSGCSSGRFSYDSNSSDFGSATFTLERLVTLEGVECSN